MRPRNCLKWLALLWLSYIAAMALFWFILPLEPNPDGPGRGGAALITAVALAALSWGLWRHRES